MRLAIADDDEDEMVLQISTHRAKWHRLGISAIARRNWRRKADWSIAMLSVAIAAYFARLMQHLADSRVDMKADRLKYFRSCLQWRGLAG